MPGTGPPGESFTGTELVGDPAATTLPATGPYTGTFKADGDLSAMAGLSQQGDWQLVVTEPNDNEIGRVNSWTLRIAAASCAPRSVAKLTATPNPVDPGANVVLDASASGSADPGGITRYEWDLADGTGFHEGATPTTATRTVSFAQRGRRTVQVRVSDATGVIGTASIGPHRQPPSQRDHRAACGRQGADLRDARRIGVQRPRRRRDRELRVGDRRRRRLQRLHRLAAQRLLRHARQPHDQASRDRRRRRAAHGDDHAERDRHHAPVARLRRHAEPGRGRPAGDLRRRRLDGRRDDRALRVGPRRQRQLRDRRRRVAAGDRHLPQRDRHEHRRAGHRRRRAHRRRARSARRERTRGRGRRGRLLAGSIPARPMAPAAPERARAARAARAAPRAARPARAARAAGRRVATPAAPRSTPASTARRSRRSSS